IFSIIIISRAGGDRMAPWKTALHQYVNARNQTEVECSEGVLADVVEDSGFMQGAKLRLHRLRDTYAERCLKPIKQETRLKLEGANETAAGTAVDLLLKRTFVYEQNERPYVEQRLERERIVFDELGGRWRI